MGVERLRRTLESSGRYVVPPLTCRGEARLALTALSGGSTVRGLYALVATDEYRHRIAWEGVASLPCPENP